MYTYARILGLALQANFPKRNSDQIRAEYQNCVVKVVRALCCIVLRDKLHFNLCMA
jgi:hypothetical protein